ncbi:MAG: hypothetical protein ACTSR9_18950 [Candidatus Thorarchaeota archaeon]
MPQIRPELIRGLSLLGIFFVLIISTDLFFPYSFNADGYTVIGIQRLNENPEPFEGLAISSTATIVSITNQGNYHLAEVSEGASLVFLVTVDLPEVGQRILLRGISWLHSNGSIQVHEFYALDYTSSIIRSIPGILLFIIMFFMIFKVDFKRLAFVSRKGGTESA